MNFSALYQSFYSPRFYRTNATQGRGIGFWFLGLISLIMVTLFVVSAYKDVNFFFNTTLPPVIDKMPTITVENGRISLDRPWPYSVPLGTVEEGEPPVQISFEDRQFSSINAIMDYMQENNILFLVTPTEIMALDPRQQKLEAFTLDTVQTREVITPQDMHSMAATAKHWVWPVVIVVGTLIMQIVLLVFALVLSLVGMVVNLVVGSKLSYATVLRFASYSLWPTSVILTVIGLFGIATASKLLVFGIAALFLIFGIASTRSLQRS